MTIKFERFMADLALLCRQHQVVICSELYERMEVWDLNPSDEHFIAFSDVVDRTKEVPNEL